jgi:hypothetical protein
MEQAQSGQAHHAGHQGKHVGLQKQHGHSGHHNRAQQPIIVVVGQPLAQPSADSFRRSRSGGDSGL